MLPTPILLLPAGVTVGISVRFPQSTLANWPRRRKEAGMVKLGKIWAPLLLAWIAGCRGVTLNEGPVFTPAGAQVVHDQNPVFIPLGPDSYGQVFENCLRVLGDYGFEILESNRYWGNIDCLPRTAPGLGLFLKPGSPDLYDRLLCTTQSYRHRVSMRIQPADNGGFFIEVVARKELEDVPRPIRATVGAAVFRNEPSVERQFEVIDPTLYESTWIPQGRDVPLEQAMLARLNRYMYAVTPAARPAQP